MPKNRTTRKRMSRDRVQPTFRQWMAAAGEPLDPHGPEMMATAWESLCQRLGERRPGFRGEDLAADDAEFLLSDAVVAEIAEQVARPLTVVRRDLAVTLDTYLQYLVMGCGRVGNLPAVAEVVERHLPDSDALAELCAGLDTEHPQEGQALASLVLVQEVRDCLVDPPLDPRFENGFSSDRLVSELCQDEGYLLGRQPTEKGLDLLSPDPDRRRRAERELTSRWIELQATSVGSPLEGAALEVFLAALLAAATGAVVPVDLLVCAARLQDDVDAYRIERTGFPDEEDLSCAVRALVEAGISSQSSRVQIPEGLTAAVLLAVLRAVDERPVRRDVVVTWVATFRGHAPAVFDLLAPLDGAEPGRMAGCS